MEAYQTTLLKGHMILPNGKALDSGKPQDTGTDKQAATSSLSELHRRLAIGPTEKTTKSGSLQASEDITDMRQLEIREERLKNKQRILSDQLLPHLHNYLQSDQSLIRESYAFILLPQFKATLEQKITQNPDQHFSALINQSIEGTQTFVHNMYSDTAVKTTMSQTLNSIDTRINRILSGEELQEQRSLLNAKEENFINFISIDANQAKSDNETRQTRRVFLQDTIDRLNKGRSATEKNTITLQKIKSAQERLNIIQNEIDGTL